MSREYWVMVALALASLLLLTVFGRPRRLRQSLFLFTLAQAISWPATIYLAYIGSIASPVRLFPKATDSNFVLAFVFLPAVFVAYYWHYPRRQSPTLQTAYTVAIAGSGALVHVAIQKYTDLLVYISFSGYRIWLIVLIAFYAARSYADWYFGQLAKARSGSLR